MCAEDERREPAAEEDYSQKERLEEGVEKIIVSRERTPRNPRWQRAWWRALVHYNERLARLRSKLPAGDSNQSGERESTENHGI